MNWESIILGFIGGLGLFMFGMEFMGEGLQKAAGSKMKNILGVLTKNRLLSVLVGALVTALIQSSSATTVMVVGFVNVGLINLTQAAGIIMGANIGTTITSWIVAMGEWTKFLSPEVLAPIFIALGVLVMSTNKKKLNLKAAGESMFGFGVLFQGLEMMSGAAKPLSELEALRNVFLVLENNAILGIIAGTVVTAILQSSSASVGILQALAIAGLVPWGSAVYIILGQNIGTCVTAILSSIGANLNAKRAAAIHFLFNVIGTIIFAIIVTIVFAIYGAPLRDRLITVTEISTVHTIFNVVSTVLLFPFANVLVYLAEHIIRGKSKKSSDVTKLDDRVLGTPSIALGTTIKQVIKMGEIAENNVKTSISALLNKDYGKINDVFETEKIINEYQEEINAFLIKLSNTNLAEKDQLIVTELFHMVSDIERVGDHAENIGELAQNLQENNLNFSEGAAKELEEISTTSLRCFSEALKAYQDQDKELAEKTLPLEEEVDKLQAKLRSKHLHRLRHEQCNPYAGVIFLDMISNLERISDHAANILSLLLHEGQILATDEN